MRGAAGRLAAGLAAVAALSGCVVPVGEDGYVRATALVAPIAIAVVPVNVPAPAPAAPAATQFGTIRP